MKAGLTVCSTRSMLTATTSIPRLSSLRSSSTNSRLWSNCTGLWAAVGKHKDRHENQRGLEESKVSDRSVSHRERAEVSLKGHRSGRYASLQIGRQIRSPGIFDQWNRNAARITG